MNDLLPFADAYRCLIKQLYVIVIMKISKFTVCLVRRAELTRELPTQTVPAIIQIMENFARPLWGAQHIYKRKVPNPQKGSGQRSLARCGQ